MTNKVNKKSKTPQLKANRPHEVSPGNINIMTIITEKITTEVTNVTTSQLLNAIVTEEKFMTFVLFY